MPDPSSRYFQAACLPVIDYILYFPNEQWGLMGKMRHLNISKTFEYFKVTELDSLANVFLLC
jgi:hypothetical protein